MGRKKWTPEGRWSVQDHEDYLLTGYSDRQLDFCLLPRKMVCCAAFLALTGSATKILLMAVNEVSWTKKKARRENGRKVEACSVAKPFFLPFGRLEAAGLARATISRGIKELILLGFIGIRKQTSGKPTLYELSDEYQQLNTDIVAKLTGSKMSIDKDRF